VANQEVSRNSFSEFSLLSFGYAPMIICPDLRTSYSPGDSLSNRLVVLPNRLVVLPNRDASSPIEIPGGDECGCISKFTL
jgi:hypothetical protein